MAITSAGNVGIGTTNPAYKLDVNASSSSDGFRVRVGGASRFIITGDGVATWGPSANIGILTWDTGKAIVIGQPGQALSLGANGFYDQLYINTAGNVGIGTTSPGAKLQIASPSSGTTLLVGRLNGESSIKALSDAGGNLALDSTGGATLINHYSSDNIWLATGGGNVGIGTISPSYKLDVSGSTRFNGDSLITGSLTTTGTISTTGHGYFNQGIWANIYRNLFGAEVFRITLTSNNMLVGTTTDDGYRLDVSGSTRFTGNSIITGSLNVTGGITGSLLGTASYATQALSASWAPSTGGSSFPYTGSALITGSLGVTGSFSTQINDNAFGYNAVFSNTNAGSSALSGLVLSNTSQNPVAIFQQNSTGDLGLFNSATTGKISLFTNSTEKMTIDSSGNVGIGSPPTNFQRLDVSAGHITTYDSSAKEGKITFNNGVGGVRWDQLNAKLHLIANSADAVTVLASGDVGIGNAAPLYKLDVNGGGNYSNGLVITGSLRGDVSALSIFSNTASVNMAANNFFNLTLVDGANTHISPVGIRPGQTVNIRIRQGVAGTGTVSFPSFVDQASGSLYTGSMVASAFDIITMITFDTSVVYLSSIRNMV
jgi:hypothetical protein